MSQKIQSQEAENEQKATFITIPPPLTFASLHLPPPEAFANDAQPPIENNTNKALNRGDKPPIPVKPQFLVNRNMNNNSSIQASRADTMTGTTKLRNLMLLREPTKKPSIRQVFSDDDTSDSLSDTDDSLDSDEEEEDSSEVQDQADSSSACGVSTASSSSFEQINEENSADYVIAKISIPEQKISKLHDPLNYGLYHEKLGKFLEDHYCISEYIESGSVADLQMRYKCRDTNDRPRNSKEGRQYTKMQSTSKRRDFILYVQQYATDKIYSLIRKGIDPNFQCSSTGETPLTILCSGESRSECISVFMALLGGGAQLDFRNKQGYTPMHVAARCNNKQMLKTLLEFKASPNVVDGRDLTPLYHCVLLGSSPEIAGILIYNGSTIGCIDSQEWSEIHQACRHGRLNLLELLLNNDAVDGDMINARNASGNTPLHVCALYNQEACALSLLMHGADSAITNFASQDAVQVAHVAANVSLASLIIDFPNHKDSAEFALVKARAEGISYRPPVSPPPEETTSKRGSKKHNRSTWTPSSLMKHSKQYILQKHGTIGRNSAIDNFTTATMPLENRFDSKLPPNAKIPDVKYPKSVENGNVGENKVRIVVRNYDAKTSDELTLRVGTRVIVLNARSAPAGYHDGMVDGQRGFFPKDCVQEVQLRRPLPDTGQKTANNETHKQSNGRSKNSIKKQHASVDAAFLRKNTMPDSASIVSFESYEDGHSSSTGRPASVRSEDMSHFQSTSVQGVYHNSRSVEVWKGRSGFGFILRGAKAEGQVHEFNPSAKYPGLQYLESVEEGSNAYNAGLRSGDFIIKIGETDVRKYGHQQLVETIRACGEPLHMQVTTVIHSHANGDTSSIGSSSTSSSLTRKSVKGHTKTDSITSALDQLDNVIAAEDMDSIEKTASVRRMPGRKVASEQLQNLFRPNSTADAIATLPRQPQQSTFSSARKPIRVLPPTLSSANTFQYENIPDDDTRSVRSMSSSSSNSSSFTTWGRSSNTPMLAKDIRAHSVSGATGERLLVQSGAKSKKVPPPPPKRIDSRLSMTIPEEDYSVRSPPHSATPGPSAATKSNQQYMPANPQSDMAVAIALAAKNRAERRSQSDDQRKSQVQEKPHEHKPVEVKSPVEDTPAKPVSGISSALSIALAAKQRILDQQKISGEKAPETKKQTFTVTPNKTSQAQRIASNNNERHMLPPPPTNLPPPPPSSDCDDVTGLSLPPPPAFPAPDPHLGQSSADMSYDAMMDLPPPPLDLLPSPTSPNPKPINKYTDSKLKPPSLGFLPPPPIPPPADDDDGCTSPNGADNLSNADSGVADVAGDGLNLSHGHRHSHDHVLGDNHSTVSSVSTTSTVSSEDSVSEYSSSSSGQSSSDRIWPLREVKNTLNSDNASKNPPPSSAPGNMYLDVLKKAKNKPSQQQQSSSNPSASPKTARKNFTVTKMTFAPISAVPAPNGDNSQQKSKTPSFVPPAPKEYSSSPETKPLFGKPTTTNTQTQKVSFAPKAAPIPIIKTTENTPSVVKPSADKTPPKAVEAPTSGDTAAPTKPVANWTVSDVTDWLKGLDLGMYVASFEENAIAGEHLPDLGKDELIELGVKPFGHRLTIERSIKKLVGS